MPLLAAGVPGYLPAPRTGSAHPHTRDDATKGNQQHRGVLPVSDLSEENIVNVDTDDHIAQRSIRQLRTNLRFVND